MPSFDKVEYFYVFGKDDTTQSFPIPIGISYVGSDPDCHLYLNDPEISAQHLRIRRRDDANGEVMIYSQSQTEIEVYSGRSVTSIKFGDLKRLELGDVLRLGSYSLRAESTPVPIIWDSFTTMLGDLLQSSRKDLQATIPPGLSIQSQHLLKFLPELYRSESETAFTWTRVVNAERNLASSFTLSNFLALFESVLLPIEWQIDNFDLYLDSRLAPLHFLPWLQRWHGIEFDETWYEGRRRRFLLDAHELFKNKGTEFALRKAIDIYRQDLPEDNIRQDKNEIQLAISNGQLTISTTYIRSPNDTLTELSDSDLQLICKSWLKKLVEMFAPVTLRYDEIRSTIAVQKI